MRYTYTKLPAEYSNFTRIWCVTLPTECRLCHQPFHSVELPSWWKVCLKCRRVYVQIFKKCWQLKDWKQACCCRECHGFNPTFKNSCRVYIQNDGTHIDVCCNAANWLKNQGKLDINDEGIGDDFLTQQVHE
jgi:hypothetical protein